MDKKAEILKRLSTADYMRHTNERFQHGRIYNGDDVSTPQITWSSAQKPRDDHDGPAWLTASEYQDTASVLKHKVAQLAELLLMSKHTVVYTGAGISASVIGQAARSGTNTVGWKRDTRTAQPTLTHHAIAALGRAGLVHSWQQQNHDGLPQKAGFPQHRICEIHGSWYDPSNPVVKYSGSLHDDAFPWMQRDAATADLVVVLGTSLGGLTADMVPIDAAARSRKGVSLGAVCINLQQTPQDGKMTLRLFEKTDVVMSMLLEALSIPLPDIITSVSFCPHNKILVPYDKNGRKLADMERNPWMVLDLEPGSRVRITPGHNIQGAQQPMYMHIGAKKASTYGGRTRRPAVGLGSVKRRCSASSSFVLDIEGAEMRLGLWWLDAAVSGDVTVLPVVNARPQFLPKGTPVDNDTLSSIAKDPIRFKARSTINAAKPPVKEVTRTTVRSTANTTMPRQAQSREPSKVAGCTFRPAQSQKGNKSGCGKATCQQTLPLRTLDLSKVTLDSMTLDYNASAKK